MNKVLLVFAGLLTSTAAYPVAIPPKAVAALRHGLPVAVAPMPASGAAKINPVMSENRLSPDRSLVVAVGEGPFAMTDVSRGGKSVELSIPVEKNGETVYVRRWFRAEDVLGRVKWDLRRQKTRTQTLIYFARGEEPVELAGRLPGGHDCHVFGDASVGGRVWPVLLLESPEFVAGETTTAYRMVLSREATPAKTWDEYGTRVAELYGEYVYRQGAPWGSGRRPIISWHPKHRRYACAAFADDFAIYVFGRHYWQGEAFGDPNDIRAGDFIRMDGNGHKFIVVRRDGDALETIEGNHNKVVSRSRKRHIIRDGKLVRNGHERKITQAFHLWNPPKNAAAGR